MPPTPPFIVLDVPLEVENDKGELVPVTTDTLRGNTILNGEGAPSEAVGIEGDWYLDHVAAHLYGPKGPEKWPGGFISLVGPEGPKGGALSKAEIEELATKARNEAEAASLAKAANLSDVANAGTARANLGLGSAATHPATDFDASGAAVAEAMRAEAAEALKAPLASPALTGNPTAPTQAEADNTTKLATTAFAHEVATTATAAEQGRAEAAEILKAPLASPALTGAPTAPTPAESDNSTKLATTAYADRAADEAREDAEEVADTAIKIVNLGTDWSAGDNVLMFSSAVAPLKGQIKDGTSAAPVTVVGATFKVSRKEALTTEAIEAVGGAGADGADVVAAMQGMSEGQAASQTQTIGGYFGAKNKSTYEAGNPDACGIYAVGNITGGTAPKASGIGAFLVGRREAGVTADINGAEIAVHNRAAAGSYASAGASDSRALWIHADGTADSGCAVNIGNPFGHKFQVGIGVPLQNGGAIKESTYRDDGEAEYSIDVRGKHGKAAIRIFSPAAGALLIGHAELATANALLEVMNDEAGRDPIAVFGSAAVSQKYTLQLRNSVGSTRLLVGGAGGDFFVGSAAGDAGIEFTAGKRFRIGASGGVEKISVTEGGLSFYGVAPVARHAAIAEPAETVASLKAAVNGLRDALLKIGITE